MKKLLLLGFAALSVLSSCNTQPVAEIEGEFTPQAAIWGKGASAITLLTHVEADGYGGRSYEMTSWDENDTIFLSTMNTIRSEESSDENGKMNYALYFNDKAIGNLSTNGESSLKVIHGPDFKGAGDSMYGQPYIYLALVPSGIGGYILGPVHGEYYRINMGTGTLETLAFALDAFYAGEMDPENVGTVVFAGAAIGSKGNNFTVTVSNLDDLTSQDYVYTNEDFTQAGAPAFSADGKSITFKVYKGDPDNEVEKTVTLDLQSGTFSIEG